MHGNARSSPLGRLGMVLRVIEEGEPVAQVARRCWSCPGSACPNGCAATGRKPSRFGRPVIAAALLPDAYQPRGGGTVTAGAAGVAGADAENCRPPPPLSDAAQLRGQFLLNCPPLMGGRGVVQNVGDDHVFVGLARRRPAVPARGGAPVSDGLLDAVMFGFGQYGQHGVHYTQASLPSITDYRLGPKPGCVLQLPMMSKTSEACCPARYACYPLPP